MARVKRGVTSRAKHKKVLKKLEICPFLPNNCVLISFTVSIFKSLSNLFKYSSLIFFISDIFVEYLLTLEKQQWKLI